MCGWCWVKGDRDSLWQGVAVTVDTANARKRYQVMKLPQLRLPCGRAKQLVSCYLGNLNFNQRAPSMASISISCTLHGLSVWCDAGGGCRAAVLPQIPKHSGFATLLFCGCGVWVHMRTLSWRLLSSASRLSRMGTQRIISLGDC